MLTETSVREVAGIKDCAVMVTNPRTADSVCCLVQNQVTYLYIYIFVCIFILIYLSVYLFINLLGHEQVKIKINGGINVCGHGGYYRLLQVWDTWYSVPLCSNDHGGLWSGEGGGGGVEGGGGEGVIYQDACSTEHATTTERPASNSHLVH